MSGDASAIERTVELAVRVWLEEMTTSLTHLQSFGAKPESVTRDVVEYTRERFRRFFMNQATQSRLPIASLNDAIKDARSHCSTWSPDDYMHFNWWIKSSCDWPATVPGWQTQLLDAIADCLPHETLSPAAFFAWKAVTNPQEFLQTGRWRELFTRGGYIEDLDVTQRPPEKALVLYRGSNWETRANWSWTGTYSTAEIYRRRHGGENGLIWVAWVPQDNVLARNRHFVRPDRLGDEYVVDTMRRDKPGWTIPIRPLDLPARQTHWPKCRTGRAALSFRPYRCQECGAMVDGRSVGHPFETVRDAFFAPPTRSVHAR